MVRFNCAHLYDNPPALNISSNTQTTILVPHSPFDPSPSFKNAGIEGGSYRILIEERGLIYIFILYFESGGSTELHCNNLTVLLIGCLTNRRPLEKPSGTEDLLAKSEARKKLPDKNLDFQVWFFICPQIYLFLEYSPLILFITVFEVTIIYRKQRYMYHLEILHKVLF